MSRDLRAALAAQAKRSRERFLTATAPPLAQAAQDEVLRQCLRPNAETAFGAEHAFASLAGFDDYRAAVPIRAYTQLAPWIERSAAGERAVLTAEQPIRFWKTTGTTTEPKKIPVTPASSHRTMESFLALQGTQLAYYPDLNERNDTTLVTHLSPKSIKQFLGPARIPFCTTTELPVEVRAGREEFLSPWLPGLQKMVEDDAERLYYLICYAALHDLYALACLHPSRFQTVVSTLNKSAPRLLKEMAAGTILGQPVREPRPDRAAELDLVWKRTGRLRPRDLWPNLKMLTSWSGSYLSRYRATMEEEFCSGFLPMPSISSEVFMTMTVDDDPVSQPLNHRGGVFEFASCDEPVEAGSPTLQFFELTPGTTYEVIITTLSGLYRYATADLFKVVGYYREVPRLEYMGRRAVSDLTGEKLAEEQVTQSVQATLKEYDLESCDFTLCGIQTEGPERQPGYVLVLEPPEGRKLSVDELAGKLDARFRAVNSRYELKRNFGDLAAVAVRPVVAGTFALYRQRRIADGTPAGQLKDRILHPQGATPLAELLQLSAEGAKG